MSLAMVWIYSFLFFILGCTHFNSDSVDESSKGIPKKVFLAPFDQVWRAVQIVMLPYPALLNSPDEGIYETDYVKGDQVWVAPHKQKKSNVGHRYKIYVFVAKGKLQDQDAIKVSVKKSEEKVIDIISNPKPIESDGLEELEILYRIKRELIIDRSLKAVKKIKE